MKKQKRGGAEKIETGSPKQSKIVSINQGKTQQMEQGKRFPLFTAVENVDCELCLFRKPTKEEIKTAKPGVQYIHYTIDTTDINYAHSKGKQHEWKKTFEKHYGYNAPEFDIVSNELFLEVKKVLALPKNFKQDDVALILLIYLYLSGKFASIQDYLSENGSYGEMRRKDAVAYFNKLGIAIPNKVRIFGVLNTRGEKEKIYYPYKKAA